MRHRLLVRNAGFLSAATGLWSAGAPVALVGGATARAPAGDFAARVVEYQPAPGQFVRDSGFSDAARALGPPIGGGVADADNTSAVTLGGFGGSITLAFDRSVRDDPHNPFGMDAIVFGNAFWPAANPDRRWGEAAVIEISADANRNGLADDRWYVIPGSHLSGLAAERTGRTWDDDVADPTYPPENSAWVPAGHTGVWTTTGFLLTDAVFASPVIDNPNGPGATIEGVYGYGDLSPTLLLGDLDADDIVDEPGMDPGAFYTTADDPIAVGVTPGSGGGDAFDIRWAVDPEVGLPAGLLAFDFIRVTTAVDVVLGPLGEISTEVDAVADVRPRISADWNRSGGVDVFDLLAYLDEWFASSALADVNSDGETDVFDLLAYLDLWFAG